MKKPLKSAYRIFYKGFVLILLTSFIFSGTLQIPAQSQSMTLPAPGVMVGLSPEFNPPVLKGIKVHPDNPFQFDFILDRGDPQGPSISNNQEAGELKQES